MEVIRSAQNPWWKRARAALAGREKGTLVLEGDRLVDDALARGFTLLACFVAEERAERAEELQRRGVDVRLVDSALLQGASGLVTSPGVLALAAAPPLTGIDDLGDLPPRALDLIAVACGVSDPGNLGALARTAEAAGARALALIGGASPWSPKALRGSMGSMLRMPVVQTDDARGLRARLARDGRRQVRAATRGGVSFEAFDWTPPLALWIAAETGDLPEAARDLEGVTIPMAGLAESLNVTAASAVLLFQAAAAARRGERAR